MEKLLGLFMVLLGIVVGAGLSYIIATVDHAKLLEIIRWTLVVILIIAGAVLTATGIIIVRGIGEE